MKIVYTYYLLTCVALCSIFSSCNNETDIYMENPDKRIQTKMQEYTAQLQISVAYFCSIGLYFLV